MALFRNFFASIGFLVVLAALLAVGWFYRGDIEAWVNRRNEIVMTQPSPELAAVAKGKIQAVLDGKGERETRLSEAELQSYVQYIVADGLPAGVNNPAVEVRDSTVAISAALDFRVLNLPGVPVENLRRALGDSALVTTELFPSIASPGHGRVDVLSLQAGVFPIPPMFIGLAIGQLGLQTEGQAVLFAIPPDVIAMSVENDELRLVRDR